MSRLFVLGNTGLDIGLHDPALPNAGETRLGRAGRAPGGKGVNQAVVAERTGLVPVPFRAPIGDDKAGHSLASESFPVLISRVCPSPRTLHPLSAFGSANAIVALGTAGCIVAACCGLGQYPAVPTDAVDTTGAGDTFCGILAAAAELRTLLA